jgi:antitoxin (DNA-binding transcriptional repressor) of toxin-antitoxin stability system
MGVPAVDLTSVPQRVRELVAEAARSGELVLTEDGEAVAKIIPLKKTHAARTPGSARGQIHMADGFDATPHELREYF